MQERSITLDLDPAAEPTTEDDVFYNEDMVTNRDITLAAVAVHRADQDRDLRLCDALAGSGIRGLRTVAEVDGIDAVINDMDPDAAAMIRDAVDANDLSDRVTVTERDAAALLSDNYHGFDIVDIDPFGSPGPFLDAAARSTRHGGLAAFTATDLGPLYGSYPTVCRRRYGSRSLKTTFGHETGLRILIREVFEAYSRYDHLFEPVLAWHEQHYSRVVGRVRESKKGCNRNLDSIGHLLFCPACRWRDYQDPPLTGTCPHCDGDVRVAGPLWTGKLARRDVAERVVDELAERGWDDAHDLAATAVVESGITEPFYDTHELASAVDVPAPRRDDLIDRLQERGYRAVETHFSPHGIRTDAPIDAVHASVRGDR